MKHPLPVCSRFRGVHASRSGSVSDPDQWAIERKKEKLYLLLLRKPDSFTIKVCKSNCQISRVVVEKNLQLKIQLTGFEPILLSVFRDTLLRIIDS